MPAPAMPRCALLRLVGDPLPSGCLVAGTGPGSAQGGVDRLGPVLLLTGRNLLLDRGADVFASLVCGLGLRLADAPAFPQAEPFRDPSALGPDGRRGAPHPLLLRLRVDGLRRLALDPGAPGAASAVGGARRYHLARGGTVVPRAARKPDALAHHRELAQRAAQLALGSRPTTGPRGEPARRQDGTGRLARGNIVVAGLFLALAVWIARRGSTRRLFSGPRLLLWGWVAAACLGPFAFDILRHTTTTDVPRYALAGLPAAMLLAAVAMSQLPPGLHVAFLALVLGVWFPGSRDNLAEVPRPVWGQYRGIDRRLNAWAGPDDVVLVHSIPTGVIGVARYLRNDIRLASWIVPLHVRRVPDDLELLLAGCRRVAIVNAHFLEADNPAEQWLRANARLVRHDIFYRFTAEVVYFEPVGRDRFFPDASPRACDVAPPR